MRVYFSQSCSLRSLIHRRGPQPGVRFGWSLTATRPRARPRWRNSVAKQPVLHGYLRNITAKFDLRRQQVFGCASFATPTCCVSAMQPLRPVGRSGSRRPGHRLVLRTVCWRCQLRAVGVVVIGEIPVPGFVRLETLDIPVSSVPVVRTRVLAR